MGNTITKAYTLAEKTNLKTSRVNANNIINLQGVQQKPYATVIVAEIKGRPAVYAEPAIEVTASIFIEQLPVTFKNEYPRRYCLLYHQRKRSCQYIGAGLQHDAS